LKQLFGWASNSPFKLKSTDNNSTPLFEAFADINIHMKIPSGINLMRLYGGGVLKLERAYIIICVNFQ
jgi:hypothetical protein